MSRKCGGLLRVKLRVEARNRKGKLVAERVKEADLMLNNFKNIIASLLIPEFSFAGAAVANQKTFEQYASVVDTGGVTRDVATHGGFTVGAGDNFLIALLALSGYDAYTSGSLGVRIRVGTSTVGPTRNDYALGAEVANGIPTQTVGADYVSWAVSIVLETAADITEAGLSLRCMAGSVGSAPTFVDVLLFRDVFTAVSVEAGGSISITYTLTF